MKTLIKQCEQWQKADEKKRAAFVILADERKSYYEIAQYVDGDVANIVASISQVLEDNPTLFDILNYAIELTNKRKLSNERTNCKED